ncbi:TolC family protein [Mucilaginibacter sp. P25]|uniref:Outer membrane protein TolC n=1 Tax=Mucilaginibacter gossypii TaxID=551996 RepID=A0A1G8EZG3_9SPHI|nr:TolC family protein [Mucilaginibacter gossypii]SDH75260.1 Outer membrane protein TolC [Mucilaginibacter gossypii]
MLKCRYYSKNTFLTAVFVVFIILTAHTQQLFAQVTGGSGFNLSLSEAVQFAKSQNKNVQAARIEESATGEDRKDAYRAALPTVNVSGSYQRFSDLTLFTEGLSHSTTGPRKPTPNAAALGVDALFNIYSGGRQRAFQKEQSSRLDLAKLNADDQSGNIALQTAGQYLDLVRLADLRKYIQDQLKRAQTRLKNINTLYKNQKVTKSDVLRAEVMLSNVELSLQQTENNISIANQRLDVMMNVPDSVRLNPTDSAAMPKPRPESLLQLIERAGISSFSVRKAAENVEIQRARVSGIQSANMPSLAFYTAYGLNYPNYLFFPSVNQAYAVGFVGLKAQYSISSLYHNKSKIAAGKLRVRELELQQQATADNITTDVKSYYIKYIEALNRISVNQRSVEQSQVNYRIVTAKYFNQLALLTDLLDADNLLQESRFNLIKAQTDALTIYYHLLYTSGNL